MVVEILGSYVVVIGASPGYRIADHVVTIGVPLIKVIAGGRFANLVLRLIAGSLHGNELALRHARAALRSGNFYFASANQHFSVIVEGNQNSKAGFAAIGTNGHVGRIDFGVRIAILEDGVVRHSTSQLNLDLRAGELGDVDLRMFSQAKHVGVVELKFGARFVPGRNTVARDHGSIEHSRSPATGVATLRGDVTMNQTDAGDAVGLSRSRRVVALVVGALVVRTLGHWPLDSGRCLRILIRRLVLRALCDDAPRNRDQES
jgi:hypothetical protein